MLQEIDLSQIDLNLLVLFDAIMRERHVGRTAAHLHLSPSAVSHGLARLRRMLHDPLFLKHPKGVVPTDRASDLAAPIGDILERIRGVVANAEGFDAERSTRRFTIGAPDAVFAVVLPPLLAALARLGPHIDLSVRAMLMRGDIERYLTLVKQAEDFSLMSPFGGKPTQGAIPNHRMQEIGKFFKNGTLEQELVHAYSSPDMVVLATIERAHVEVGGLPPQDWALRVTLVYRREGSEWRLAHRHADPLGARTISLTESAALARGDRAPGG